MLPLQETSGKDNAARHLMDRFDAAPHGCFLLCDDDNDLRTPHKVTINRVSSTAGCV